MLPTENIFEQVIDTINEGLFVVSEEGVITLCNDAFVQMTGYGREELIGKSCEVLRCDNCAKTRALATDGSWCGLFNLGEKHNVQCILRRKDDSWLPVIKNARVLRMEDGKRHAVETLVDTSALLAQERRLAELNRLLDTEHGFGGLVGSSPAMQKVYRVLERAASSDVPVLVLGESGTGKELAAHAIHAFSARREHPYISVNCAALNESVLESELFGHVRGAFTGAGQDRDGRFAAAHNGTLFLDEVGDMPLSMQAKLLRVLETGEYQAVGDNAARKANVRLVTATNRSLDDLVRNKLFREDLLFRIRVIPVSLPPLRERREDIPSLVQHLCARIAKRTGADVPALAKQTMQALYAHQWPGNVRELKNALEYGIVLAAGKTIEPEHLPLETAAQTPFSKECLPRSFSFAGRPSDAGQTTNRSEKDEAVRTETLLALEKTGGNISQAALLLGVHRSTLHTRIHRLQLFRPKFQAK